MESKIKTRVTPVKKEVKTYKFYASFDYPRHIYQMIVENGELVEATYSGPGRRHAEYYTHAKNYDAFRYILISIMCFNDLEELKNLYSVLNDGPIKDIVKSVQQEFIEKLTF